MGDPKATARTAVLIVAGIVIILGLWLLWPSMTGQEKPVTVDQPAVEASVQAQEPDTTAIEVQQVIEEPEVKSQDFRLAREGEFASVNEGQFYTTKGITELVPEDKTSEFEINERVYVYAGVRALNKENVRFKWFDSGDNELLPSSYLEVEPNLGQVGYRVYTYRVFRNPGEYSVVLFNSAGSEIARQKFTVK